MDDDCDFTWKEWGEFMVAVGMVLGVISLMVAWQHMGK